ncbi:uncharacterized protein LOC102917898 isoform X2 [Peromyscus maniculatus bairdii]|uniref:uncharacterized protein LOC102917898 isoform X2 n=1 Tax=Peromyscus maniculatus bairdii TaxID=230844 RepID=UPI003FD3CBBF
MKQLFRPVVKKTIKQSVCRQRPESQWLCTDACLTVQNFLPIELEPIRKHIREISARHHHLCEIGIKFNDTIARAVELILLTKKQPKANFSEIAKLTTGIKKLHETCCEGNTVACALGSIISPTALREDLHIAHSRAVELHVYKVTVREIQNREVWLAFELHQGHDKSCFQRHRVFRNRRFMRISILSQTCQL